MPKHRHPTWQHRHEAVLRWMLQNPSGRQAECARATGYSRSQISRIVNAPDFQHHYQNACEIVRVELVHSAIKRPSSRLQSGGS